MIAEALLGTQVDMGGTQVQIVEKRRQIPSLEGIDNRFRPLLEAMLQPDPANRPESMAEIAGWTLGAPMQRQVEDRTVIRPSSPPPEQAALDQAPPATSWAKRVLVALSLLGIAGVGAAGVYFLVGQTVPDQDQKPVLVAAPREDAPEAPEAPPVTPPEAERPAEIIEPETTAEPPAIPPGTTDPGTGRPDQERPEIASLSNEQVNEIPEKEALKPEDKVRNFVSSYQAGDCMYLQPIEIAARLAEIEGFASRTPPFISFDSDFTQSQGFEAKIQVNLVSDAQCPAISFLRATPQGNVNTELHLDMQRTIIPNGENMAGRISGYDPSTGGLGLVFVNSKGEVSNISPYLQTDDGGAGFVVPLALKTPAEETGLIIAMVGEDIAGRLSKLREKKADAFFENLMRGAPVLRATATTVKVVP